MTEQQAITKNRNNVWKHLTDEEYLLMDAELEKHCGELEKEIGACTRECYYLAKAIIREHTQHIN